MNRPGTLLALCLTSILTLAGCGGRGGGSAGGGSAMVKAGPAQTVSGVVSDLGTGARLAAVAVTAAGQTTTSDANGAFTLTGITTATVGFARTGYGPGFTSVNATTAADVVVMRLKKQPRGQVYDTSRAATVSETTEAGPYALILTPNSLDTTDTRVTISITPLDPTKERDALPGSLVAGGTNPSLLLPVTFAEFSLVDSSGRRVNLKPSSSAIVELPIPPSLRASYPAGTKVHCYSYNPATGKWEDFVEGTVQVSSVDGTSLVLSASIRHFSWYGAAPEGSNCADLYVKVLSATDGRPLESARVEASPGTTAYTDAGGNARVVSAVGSTSSSIAAYQTGLDIDGSLTGTAGAKYIEWGKVEPDLAGLAPRPCTGAGTSAAPGRARALAAGGSTAEPIVLKVGQLTRLLYEVQATLLAATPGSGIVTASVRGGVPDANGVLQNPMDITGAKLSLLDPRGTRTPLTPVANVDGAYSALNASLTPGEAYTLLIDADGNGSIDG